MKTLILLAVAFLVREINTGGFTKQCEYNYLGNTYTITIQATQICPLQIEVNP